jgi:hypothetical protein
LRKLRLLPSILGYGYIGHNSVNVLHHRSDQKQGSSIGKLSGLY